MITQYCRAALSALLIIGIPSLCGAQDMILWPMPGEDDIRGTYCDYRNSNLITYDYFHSGIDIHSSPGTLVFPPFNEVFVYNIDTSLLSSQGATLIMQEYGGSEFIVYGHVTPDDGSGHPIENFSTYLGEDRHVRARALTTLAKPPAPL